jgi:HlyD family secretion protein
MRFLVRFLLLIGVLVGIGYASYTPVVDYLKLRSLPKYRFAPATKGSLETFVSATGEVKPVLEVAVGAFVSGPIIELNADFNDRVNKGDVLAVIDPRLFQAALESDEASLANRKAEVERTQVLLEQATRLLDRSRRLQTQGEGYISETELDNVLYSKLSLAAQAKIAQAAVKQSEAALENSRANLGYTKIVAPVSGIIIDRKIDLGQTLAAQFQTPVLFVIAPEMEKNMHVYASIDEADIGLVRKSQESGREVSFVVDAYTDEIFKGKIAQIRFKSENVQNVVTYPVVVTTSNPDLKLMPGMTANLVFASDEVTETMLVPNAAIRFYPEAKWVRPEDLELLGVSDRSETNRLATKSLDSNTQQLLGVNSTRRQRHVWVLENHLLRAVPVRTGLSDHRFTQVESTTLTEGTPLVIGTETK